MYVAIQQKKPHLTSCSKRRSMYMYVEEEEFLGIFWDNRYIQNLGLASRQKQFLARFICIFFIERRCKEKQKKSRLAQVILQLLRKN